MRKTQFANEEFYHVYNRGVDKRDVFMDPQDYSRFLACMLSLNTVEPTGGIYAITLLDMDKRSKMLKGEKLVEIVAYCLNTNHYHFLLKQASEKGVQKFMHRLSTAYTMYFNEKNKRTGSLFQGPFKAIHVQTDDYLRHVSAYVNLNNKVHKTPEGKYRSSWKEYMAEDNKKGLCRKGSILSQFKSKAEYKEFAEESVRMTRHGREEDKKLLSLSLEDPEVFNSTKS